jgi:hypothetical protein
MKFVELNSVTRTLLLRSGGTIGDYVRYDDQGQLLAMRTESAVVGGLSSDVRFLEVYCMNRRCWVSYELERI